MTSESTTPDASPPSPTVYVGSADGVEARQGVRRAELAGGPFGWGKRDGPAHRLASALLSDALGDPAPGEEIVHAFAHEVVARLPADSFRLTSDDVLAWVAFLGSDPDEDLIEQQRPAGLDSILEPIGTDVDPAERPRQEAGQGSDGGFELSEQALVDYATGRREGGDPSKDAFPPESRTPSSGAPPRDRHDLPVDEREKHDA